MGGKASRVHDGRAASTPAVRAGAAGDDASTAAAGAAPLSRHGSKKLPRNDSRRAEVAVSRSECLHDDIELSLQYLTDLRKIAADGASSRLVEKCDFVFSLLDSSKIRTLIARHDEWLRLHDKVTSMASGGGDNELANYLVKTYAVAGDDADFTSTVALPPLHGIKRLKATTRAVYIGRKWKTAGYDHRDVFLGLPAVKKLAGLSSHQESDVRELSQNLDSWDFDVLAMHRVSGGNSLTIVGWMLFSVHQLFKHCDIPADKVSHFLTELQRGYLDNPYHNAAHAADVAQSVHVFLIEGVSARLNMSPHEVFALLLGAMVHDFRHPGRTNAFSVATSDDLALTYNDRAVLENYHVAEAYRLMQRDACAVLQTMAPSESKAVREIVISTVLATDMAAHFNKLADFKSFLAKPGDDELSEADRKLVMSTALHAADISNTAKKGELYLPWMHRVMSEFYAQGDAERSGALPVSAFMDRSKPAVAKCQQGFIGFIVGPLFAEWGKFVVSLAPVFAANLDANKACWDDADNVAKAERSIAQIDEAFAGSGAGAAAAARAESIGN